MQNSRNKLKKKQKKRLITIFLRTVAITLVVIGIACATFALVYNKFINTGGKRGNQQDLDPINKTVAVFGVDKEGYRTDVIFVVNFNSETNKARVISIPRDTRVEWSPEMQSEMQELKGYSVSVSKINEMTSYAGIENIEDFTIPEIEDILGLQIDNYVIVTIDAFREIVDAIGGVEVDVPVLDGNGLQYDDNAQDLHIHLSPGIQTLDGEAAEGLVRFRKGYAEGDVGRIKTQQLFLEAFAKKVTSPQIITKLPAITSTIFKTVTTDVGLSELTGYLPYLKSITPETMKFGIVPGEASYSGGKSYYIIDEAAVPEFVQETLYGTDETEVSTEINKEVSIEILNSTGTRGLAGNAKKVLETQGYTVSEIGNYEQDILEETIIYAKDINQAGQFLNYYNGAHIIQSDQIPYDIQIILGNDYVVQE